MATRYQPDEFCCSTQLSCWQKATQQTAYNKRPRIWQSCMCAQVCAQSSSRVWLFAIPWMIANQAPLSMGFSRQEYWSGLLFPPPGDLPNPGIKPSSLTRDRTGPPALRMWSLSHWTSREVLVSFCLSPYHPFLLQLKKCSCTSSFVQ